MIRIGELPRWNLCQISLFPQRRVVCLGLKCINLPCLCLGVGWGSTLSSPYPRLLYGSSVWYKGTWALFPEHWNRNSPCKWVLYDLYQLFVLLGFVWPLQALCLLHHCCVPLGKGTQTTKCKVWARCWKYQSFMIEQAVWCVFLIFFLIKSFDSFSGEELNRLRFNLIIPLIYFQSLTLIWEANKTVNRREVGKEKTKNMNESESCSMSP